MTTQPTITLPDLPGAACGEFLDDTFFPGKWDSDVELKALCRKCPEVSACLKWALDNNEEHGIWGATDEAQRRKLRRNRDRRSRAKEAS